MPTETLAVYAATLAGIWFTFVAILLVIGVQVVQEADDVRG